MTNEQFKSLRRGDVIRGCGSGIAFVVDAHYGDYVIAMKSMHVSNPSEWELCASEDSGAVANGETISLCIGCVKENCSIRSEIQCCPVTVCAMRQAK